MDNSFFKLDGDDSVADDADSSFLNLSGSRAGSDFSFYEGDTSLFSGEQSPPPLFMTPGPPASQTPAKRKKTEEKKTPAETSGPPASQASAKRKKIEEKMTPTETSFSTISSAPGDESQLFGDAIQTPTKNSSFSSSAPTPRIQVETMKEMEKEQLVTDIPAPATPTTPPGPEMKENKEKEMMDGQAKEVPPNLKLLLESKMKGMLDSLMALEAFQVQGGDQLLAKASSVQEEVSAYKEELANVKESYQKRINLAASFINPGSK